MSKVFTTKFGGVAISKPFSMFGVDEKQVEVTYKPSNYSGWGISKTCNAIEVEIFEQADAEFFASVAESKLRITRPTAESFMPYEGTKLNPYEMGEI